MPLPPWLHLHWQTQGMSDCCDLDVVCECTSVTYWDQSHNGKVLLVCSSTHKVKTEALHCVQGVLDMSPTEHGSLWSKPFVLAKTLAGHCKPGWWLEDLTSHGNAASHSRVSFEECTNKHHNKCLEALSNTLFLSTLRNYRVKHATIFNASLHLHLHMLCIIVISTHSTWFAFHLASGTHWYKGCWNSSDHIYKLGVLMILYVLASNCTTVWYWLLTDLWRCVKYLSRYVRNST